jgi:hypothetical protein
VPAGFEVQILDPGFAQVFGEGGYFVAYLTPSPTTENEMVANTIGRLEAAGVQELTIASMADVPVPSSAVVSAMRVDYTGVWATQQGGTSAIQVISFHFVLQDGSGVTAFGLFDNGAAADPNSPLVQGYNVMLNSLVGSF